MVKPITIKQIKVKNKEPPDKYIYKLNDFSGKQKGITIPILADKRKLNKPIIATDKRGKTVGGNTVLTYHVKHCRDLSNELTEARKIAEFIVKNNGDKDSKIKSTSQLKDFNLKTAISNQIIRKYKDPKIHTVNSINLPLPNQSIKYDKVTGIVKIIPLDIKFEWKPDLPNGEFSKINAIEISEDRFMLSVSYTDLGIKSKYPEKNIFSLDHNCGYGRHIMNGADHKNKTVLNLGKSGPKIRHKYQKLRQKYQKAEDYTSLKEVSDREYRKMKDLDHKISRAVVNYADKNDLQIVLEDLGGIRKTKKSGNGSKKANRIVNSWSFYRLMSYIKYKSKLLGIPVTTVSPINTSQLCSYCYKKGDRKGIDFQCTNKCCKKKMNADVNAAYNIGKRFMGKL